MMTAPKRILTAEECFNEFDKWSRKYIDEHPDDDLDTLELATLYCQDNAHMAMQQSANDGIRCIKLEWRPRDKPGGGE